MNIIQWLFGPAISRIIMPSQNREDKFQELRQIKQKNGVEIKHTMLDSTGGAKIDLATFKPIGREQPPPNERKVIIFYCGQSLGYESKFDFLLAISRKYPDATIAAFNYRNVHASSGTAYCEQDWVDDANAVVQHFKQQGYRNKNILGSGYSLGGAISTMSLYQLYKQEKQARAESQSSAEKEVEAYKLLNNRSFSTLTDEIMYSLLGKRICSAINAASYGLIFAALAYSIPHLFGMSLAISSLAFGSMMLGGMVGILVGGLSMLHQSICYDLTRPVVDVVLKITFGTMDAINKFKKYPKDSKDYLVAKNDSRIKGPAGLHAHYKKEIKEQKAELHKKLKQLVVDLDNASSETRPQLLHEIEEYKAKIRDINDSKLRHAIIPKDGHAAHVDRLDLLTTYHHLRGQDSVHPQINGQQVWENKVNRLLDMKPVRA